MFVAITKINEKGQPIFCVNPVDTTLDFNQAFKFYDRNEVERNLKESKQFYNLDAVPVEIMKSKQEEDQEKVQGEEQEEVQEEVQETETDMEKKAM